MKTYKLTAYEKDGSLITEETFTAESDDAAKEQGRSVVDRKRFARANAPPSFPSW